MLSQEVEVTKSLSRNLLKQYYVSVDSENTRVIDSNELAKKKIAELNRKMQESVKDQGFQEFEADFTDGIEAIRVAELLEEDTEAEAAASSVFKPAPVYNGPSEEEINEMVNQRLKEAEMQAEQIVNSAMKEAESIRENAYAEGSGQGYEDGVRRAEAELSERTRALEEKEALLERNYEAKVSQLEPAFVDTITSVYEQIFSIDLSDYSGILAYLVESIMKKSDDDTQFMVHVSPKDYELVLGKKAEMLSVVSRDNIRLEIIEDVTVADKQCIIETENGVFDCGIDTQLSELKKRFKLLSFQKN